MARAKTHSAFYELAKEKYDSGKWTAKMLRKLVDAGKITEAEYDEIVNGEPENGE